MGRSTTSRGAAAVIVTHSAATAAVADRVLTLTADGLRNGTTDAGD